eukprot:Gb_15332 [translate_table: standard]
MGGESSSSTVESRLDVVSGSENELLRIRGAHLCLLDWKESVIIQSGDFAFHISKQIKSPFAAVVALVGDLHWPVGKDSPTLNVAANKYTFALPGLVYGLVLPCNAPVEAVQSLEGLLHQYSTFEQHPEVSAGINDSQALSYWTAVAPEQTGSTSGKITVGSHSDVSPRMMNRIQQARRMSAVAKLLCKTLVRGAINAKTHVVPRGLAEPTICAPHLAKGIRPGNKIMAIARVDAFAKVVEAVETAGRSLLAIMSTSIGSEFEEETKQDIHVKGNEGVTGETTWTLNKAGLRLLLQATAASAVIHVTCRGIGESPSYTSSPHSVLSYQASASDPNNSPLQHRLYTDSSNSMPALTTDHGAQPYTDKNIEHRFASYGDVKNIYGTDITSQFIPPTPISLLQTDSVCCGSTRPSILFTAPRPHGPSSPFQQYSRP